MRFFTADTHFHHVKAIEHGRPFSSMEEMNEVMIERWNKVVGPNDEVYHLGDFAMGKREFTVQTAAKLNGIKYLAKGNHDHLPPIHKHKRPEMATFYRCLYEAHFHELFEEKRLVVCGVECLLAHLPYVGDHKDTDPRFLEFRPDPKCGLTLLHGHVHDEWLVREDPGLPTMVNVGVDVWDYAPVPEEALEIYL